jgi:hypothetical protein
VNKTTVICIVHNVSDFETNYDGWVEELKRVFDWLRTVPDELRQGINFELLMTPPGRVTKWCTMTDPSKHLSLIGGNLMGVGRSE